MRILTEMEGWIKLHRQITENKFYFSERFSKTQAWIDLLILASYNKDKTLFIRGIEINLKPGELCYSQLTLAKRWKWSDKTVKRFLELLKSRNMINFRGGKVTTIIKIINWKKYQISTEQNQPIKSISEGGFSALDSEQNPNNFRTNKNNKNEKNINKPKRNLFSIENMPLNLNGELFYKNKYFYITQEFKKELMQQFRNKNFTDEILENEFYKMEAWLEANEKKKNYKLFIVNWLGKIKEQQSRQNEFNFSFNPIGKINEQKN